jgi:hypothetical protein
MLQLWCARNCLGLLAQRALTTEAAEAAAAEWL